MATGTAANADDVVTLKGEENIFCSTSLQHLVIHSDVCLPSAFAIFRQEVKIYTLTARLQTGSVLSFVLLCIVCIVYQTTDICFWSLTVFRCTKTVIALLKAALNAILNGKARSK